MTTKKQTAIASNVLSLNSDADFINQEVQAGDQAFLSGLEHYRKAGERLSIVRDRYLGKKSTKGDSFRSWVEQNCKFSKTHAYNYITLAENYFRLSSSVGQPNLSLREALKLIASEQKTTIELTDEELAAKHEQWLAQIEIASKVSVRAVDRSKLIAVTSIRLQSFGQASEAIDFVNWVKQCRDLSLTRQIERRKQIVQAVKHHEPEMIREIAQEIKAAKQIKQNTSKPDKLIDNASQKTIDVTPVNPVQSDPYASFSDYERSLVPRLLAGETVVAAMYNFTAPYTDFLKWAQSQNMLVKIDRTSKDWGNPFKVGEDGTIDYVMESYEKYYLPRKAGLMQRIPLELKGKVLACWCKKDNCNIKGLAAIQPCHGDILAAIANVVK